MLTTDRLFVYINIIYSVNIIVCELSKHNTPNLYLPYYPYISIQQSYANIILNSTNYMK